MSAVSSTELLPQQVQMKLAAFLRGERTGSVTLHVERGQIRAWEVKETGRIDKGTTPHA